MHLVIRYALSLRAAITVLALAGCARAVGEAPMLAPATRPLSDVVPLRALDNLELAPAPRVASRPALNWQPGGSSLYEPPRPAIQPAPTEGSESDSGAPLLVAPNSTPKSALKADGAGSERAEPVAVPPDTDLLPLMVPRGAPSIEPKPASVEPKPAPSALKAPRTLEADDLDTRGKAIPAPAVRREPAAPPRTAAQPARPRVAPRIAPALEPLATKPPEPLTRSLRNLQSRVRTVLSYYYRQPLNTVEHDPWEIMHSMLAYELHSRVRDGGPKGPYLTAVGHLCFNRASKRQQILTISDDGYLDAQVGVGLQGHRGQFLAMLAQCNVSPDYPIRVEGKDFTIRDLIEGEQRTCYTKTELTFKLIGLGHYLESDAEWVNDRGERWDIPRLIAEERVQPIRGAACGGTHRLTGLSLAFRRREARRERVDGEYAEAARFVAQHQAYALRLQNEDGSLSTDWFAGPGADEDLDRRLRTTGHLLEWLVYSLPEEQLRSYNVVRSVSYLTNLLATNADRDWHLGSIAHATHALVLYDKRVFRPHDQPSESLAAVDPAASLFREYPIYRGVMRNGEPESAGFLGLFGGSPSRTSSNPTRRR